MKEPPLTPREKVLLDKIAGDPKKKRVRLNDEPLPAIIPNELGSGTKLPKLEENFVHYYTTHYNQIRAAIEAGYPAGRAHILSRDLLKRHDIRQAVSDIEQTRLKRLRIDGDYLLNRILQIALADPNELVQVWIPPCRYCYGKNHLIQRTHAEMEHALELHNRGYVVLMDGTARKRHKSDPPFDEGGGVGYDIDLPPNPDCPECKGRGGDPTVQVKDSRFLSADGRALYAGAKKGSNGQVEIMARNQDAAWSLLSRFAERWLTTNQQRAVTISPEEMTTEELDSMLGVAEDLGFDVTAEEDC